MAALSPVATRSPSPRIATLRYDTSPVPSRLQLTGRLAAAPGETTKYDDPADSSSLIFSVACEPRGRAALLPRLRILRL
jgi:hypothetical protein